MITKNHWQIIVVLSFLLSGCTARHIVVIPEDAKALNDTQWNITQEPLLIIEPPGIIEEETLFE